RRRAMIRHANKAERGIWPSRGARRFGTGRWIMDSYGVRFPLPPDAGRGLRFLIVEGRSYPEIADEMRRGAVAALEQAGATHEIIAVPSAMEVPVAVAMALETGRFDGYIALGCVIRGQTNHYVSVASESIRALAELAVVDALPL